MSELKVLPIENILPYKNNPRKNDEAVEPVAESIRQCGYISPIVVDENNVILAGHTRLKALKSTGETQVEVVVRKGLTEEQKRKYRVLDNKTGELAKWDYDLLPGELEGLDFGNLDLDWGIGNTEALSLDDIGEVDGQANLLLVHCPKCGFAFEVKK